MQEQISHFQAKLRYEIDSWDLNETVQLADYPASASAVGS